MSEVNKIEVELQTGKNCVKISAPVATATSGDSGLTITEATELAEKMLEKLSKSYG